MFSIKFKFTAFSMLISYLQILCGVIYISYDIVLGNRCNGTFQGVEKRFCRPWLAFSDMVLDLCKRLFNWVKLRRIGRQEGKRHLAVFQKPLHGLGAMHRVVVHDQELAAGHEGQHVHIQIGDEALGREGAEVPELPLDAVRGQHCRRADGHAGRGGPVVVDALALGGAAIVQAQVQGTPRFVKVDAVFRRHPFQLAGVAVVEVSGPFRVLFRVVEGLFFIAEAHALEREVHRGLADADPVGLLIQFAEPLQRHVHFLQEEGLQVQFPFRRNRMGMDGMRGAGGDAAGFVEQLLKQMDGVRADLEVPGGFTHGVGQRVIQNPLS